MILSEGGTVRCRRQLKLPFSRLWNHHHDDPPSCSAPRCPPSAQQCFHGEQFALLPDTIGSRNSQCRYLTYMLFADVDWDFKIWVERLRHSEVHGFARKDESSIEIHLQKVAAIRNYCAVSRQWLIVHPLEPEGE